MSAAHSQRGAAAALVVLLLPMMIALAGLLVDGGMMIVVKFRLQSAVEAAAMAAADAYDREVWRTEGRVVLDSDLAADLAQEYFSRNFPEGWLTRVELVSENRVRVEGEANSPVFFLKMFKVHTQTVTAVYATQRG